LICSENKRWDFYHFFQFLGHFVSFYLCLWFFVSYVFRCFWSFSLKFWTLNCSKHKRWDFLSIFLVHGAVIGSVQFVHLILFIFCIFFYFVQCFLHLAFLSILFISFFLFFAVCFLFCSVFLAFTFSVHFVHLILFVFLWFVFLFV